MRRAFTRNRRAFHLAGALAVLAALSIPVSLFLAQAALILLTVQGMAYARAVWRRDRALVLAIGAVGVAWVLSWIFSPRGIVAFRNTKDLWVLLLLPSCVALRVPLRRYRLRILSALAVGIVVAGVLAILQATAHWDPLRPESPWVARGRATGFFNNPLTFAGVATLSGWALWAFALRERVTLKYRLTWMAGGSIAFVGVLLSQSMSYWLALPVLLVLAAWFQGTRASVTAWTLLVVVGVIALSLGLRPSLPEIEYTPNRRFPAVIRISYESWQNNRVALWHIGLRCVEEHPVTGTGRGAAGYKWTIEKVVADFNAEHPGLKVAPHHMHNNALQVLVETGLVGLLATGLLVIVVTRVWATRYPRHGPRAGPMLAIGAGVILLLPGLFEYNLGDLEFLLALLFLVGLTWPQLPRTCRAVPGA